MRPDQAVAALRWLPVVAVLAAWLGWIVVDGGYFPRAWYPVAIGLVAALVACVGGGLSLPSSKAARASLAALAAFTAWTFLSIAWADAPGAAWEASNKLLPILAGASVLVFFPWSSRSAAGFLGVWTLGIAVACVVALGYALGATSLETTFIERRFASPLGYAGGTSALAALGIWPAVALSARRDTWWPLQILFLAIAAFLAGFAIMPQARGALVGLVVSVPVLLALAPDRGRALARILVVVGAVGLSLGDVLDVYSVAKDQGDVAGALDSAAGALALAAAAAAIGAAVIAFVERRLKTTPTTVRRTRIATAAVLGLALLAAGAVLVANAGTVADTVSGRWDEFRAGEGVQGESRLASTADPQRYDYWRVAVDTWREEPLAGAGAGSFGLRYSAERREAKHSRYAHNLWLRYLSETGVVGLGLFVLFIAFAVAALVASWRRMDNATRSVVAGAFTPLAYFLAHGSLDWVDEFPALAAPAVGLPLLALKVAAPAWPRERTRGRRASTGALTVIAAAVVLALGVASLTLPYLSLRYSERAARVWRVDREKAFDDLGRAKSVDPLSSQPFLIEGAIAIELRDERRAVSAYRDAIDREDTWYPHFELALIAANQGDFVTARREIRTASILNVHDPTVEAVQKQISRGRRLDPREVHKQIRDATRERFYGIKQPRSDSN